MTTVGDAGDTCDACPAEAQVQAYVYAEHPDWAASLAYCAHHGTQYMVELIACHADIVDLRHLVTP